MNFKEIILSGIKNTAKSLKEKLNLQLFIMTLAFVLSFSFGYLAENTANASVKSAYKLTVKIYKNLKGDVKDLIKDKDALTKNKDDLVKIYKNLEKTYKMTDKTINSIYSNLKTTLKHIGTTADHVSDIPKIPKAIF